MFTKEILSWFHQEAVGIEWGVGQYLVEAVGIEWGVA
jgi:hypothetical protein